jgi:hypothetical protein
VGRVTISGAVWRALCAMYLASLAPCGLADTLRIGSWEREARAPLTVVSEAILAQAYAEVKQPVEFVDLPIRRAMIMMLNQELGGNTDRLADLAIEQPSLYRVETPVNVSEVRVYILAPQQLPAGWSQLAGLRVACQRGVLLVEVGLLVEPIQSLPDCRGERHGSRATRTCHRSIPPAPQFVGPAPRDWRATQHCAQANTGQRRNGREPRQDVAGTSVKTSKVPGDRLA